MPLPTPATGRDTTANATDAAKARPTMPARRNCRPAAIRHEPGADGRELVPPGPGRRECAQPGHPLGEAIRLRLALGTQLQVFPGGLESRLTARLAELEQLIHGQVRSCHDLLTQPAAQPGMRPRQLRL